MDKSGESISVGRSEFDSPDIDNIVHINGKVQKGEFCYVQITEVNEYELIAMVL